MSTPADRTAALLATPSLAGLSYALRHLKEVRPKWRWHYDDCTTCAMGLAYSLWPEIGGCFPGHMMRAFDMPMVAAWNIFCNATPGARRAAVADRIDTYLAHRKAA